MTLRRAVIRAFDRPGGRKILGAFLTGRARKAAPSARIYFQHGMWMHQTGESIFVDFPEAEYHPSSFRHWVGETERNLINARDHWCSLYEPRAGDLIMDVGAGKGEDVLAFSQAVGPSGTVIAIEAHPTTFRCLSLFCELNRLLNVKAIQCAATGKLGVVALETEEHWQDSYFGSTAGSVLVPGLTLDEVIEREEISRIDLLKMNIEGAEAAAVEGMVETLRITRTLCISCHDFRANNGDGEQFRTKAIVEEAVRRAGFRIVPRAADPRPYIVDQVNAVR